MYALEFISTHRITVHANYEQTIKGIGSISFLTQNIELKGEKCEFLYFMTLNCNQMIDGNNFFFEFG